MCVLQGICIAMNQQHIKTSTLISSQRLRWATDDPYGELQGLPNIDIILASDCLFFKDFHQDLLWLLRYISRGNNTVIYLLQPERSGSMRAFISLAIEYFNIDEVQDYNEQVRGCGANQNCANV